MFLALDIGNSHVKAGLHDGAAWARIERFPTAAIEAGRLGAFVEEAEVEGAGLASVVPSATEPLATAVRHLTGRAPVVVHAGMALPFRMAYATPDTLGADRLAAAAAAWLLLGKTEARPVAALDAGTAITTEVLTAEGVYLGGAIAPGPALLRRALASETAQLPGVDWPAAPFGIGDSTHTAIQAGLSALVADGVAGLLRRAEAEVGARPFVVATGGWADWLARHVAAIDRVEPALVLDGVRLLAGG